jgi:hypothetical protein
MKLDVADETLIGRRKAVSSAGILRTPLPMPSDDTIEPFCFPAVGRKKLAAAFDGGRL